MPTTDSAPESSLPAKDAFYENLAAMIIYAYKNRSKERHLYAPMSSILAKRSDAIKHESASIKLSVHSQYHFESLSAAGGQQVSRHLANLSARTGYSLIGAKPKTAHTMACEYFHLDWDTGQSVS